ncbi:MAG TPA: cupredoxin domain-containing protein [Acidimicrobiales bacterium]|nr:cupredoxin domain-containing protein [Acidimicrobiales bacterium]
MLAAVAVTMMVFTACGDDDDPTIEAESTSTTVAGPSTTTSQPPAPIIVRDFSFTGLEVKAGARVLVQNQGPSAHTLTAEDNRFDTGSIASGSNAQLTIPSTPGTYRIKCSIHPTRMTGELKVT